MPLSAELDGELARGPRDPVHRLDHVDRDPDRPGLVREAALDRRGDRLHVLVAGQVEDDRAVLTSDSSVRTNLELLRRVREERPGAYIIYKPHPDVEAGHRAGSLADQDVLRVADEIVRDWEKLESSGTHSQLVGLWADLIDAASAREERQRELASAA